MSIWNFYFLHVAGYLSGNFQHFLFNCRDYCNGLKIEFTCCGRIRNVYHADLFFFQLVPTTSCFLLFFLRVIHQGFRWTRDHTEIIPSNMPHLRELLSISEVMWLSFQPQGFSMRVGKIFTSPRQLPVIAESKNCCEGYFWWYLRAQNNRVGLQ